ncbi:hypothetical protein [Beijerinckia sp. L45]|uniref:hypothetical protein n=1 Tax=Beijerinckia sp. L45 TaxID=1641855 RepID=UPI00131C76E9|nr:hypothetical protein [Beijerinckia sp. L45]
MLRQHVEQIDGVTRTWFELNSNAGFAVKTLVVEVNFDTDPNASDFRQDVIDAIEGTAKAVLAYQTTQVIDNLKIVPRRG